MITRQSNSIPNSIPLDGPINAGLARDPSQTNQSPSWDSLLFRTEEIAILLLGYSARRIGSLCL